MTMIENMFNSRPLVALERMAAFTERRQGVLVNNIANIDTPGYIPKDMDTRAFQADLRKALDRASSAEEPQLNRDQYVLFHDRNNRSVEYEVSEMSRNYTMNHIVAELLYRRFNGLKQAISLKVS
jgi:flagellar basal body rod protein FlgB